MSWVETSLTQIQAERDLLLDRLNKLEREYNELLADRDYLLQEVERVRTKRDRRERGVSSLRRGA